MGVTPGAQNRASQATYTGNKVTGGQGTGGQSPLALPTGMPPGYSGIRTRLKNLRASINDPKSMRRILQWQWNVSGESAKINAFKAEVGSLLSFQAFLMMWEGSVMVTILHSIAKYFSISSATTRYQGWHIGFLGDRLPTPEPGPVLLLATKGWD
jgi:hypothetical protein